MSDNVTHINKQINYEDEIDLIGILRTIMLAKGFIIAMVVVFILIAYAYIWWIPPIYKADALLQVEQKQSTIPGIDLFEDLGSGKPKTTTEIEILKSRKILGQVVDNLQLSIIAEPDYYPFIGRAFSRNNKDNKNLPKLVSTVLNWLPLDIMTYSWGSEFIDIATFVVPEEYENVPLKLIVGENSSYQVFDTQTGTKLLQGLVGETIVNNQNNIKLHVKYVKAAQGQSFTLTRKSRLKAIEGLRGQLKISETAKNTGIIRLTMKGRNKSEIVRKLDELNNIYLKLNVSRTSEEATKSLEFLQKQVKIFKGETGVAENELQEFKTKNNTTDLTLETTAIMDRVSQIDMALQSLLLKKAELEKRYTNKHPAILALIKQESRLQQQKNIAISKSSGLPKKQQILLQLERNFKVKSSIYIDILNKIQEFKVAKAAVVGNVYILDKAVFFDKQVSPRPALTMAIASIFGLIFAVATAFLKSMFKKTVDDANALEIATSLPVYVTVPKSKRVIISHEIRKVRRHQKELLRITAPNDPAVESLRSLRTSLRFALLESSNNIVMITGASPAAGKTFIASNFSAVVADSKQRVLLVDCDMRRSYLPKFLHLNESPGLSEVIVNTQLLADSIQGTDIDGLDVITRGQLPPNPSELLMHDNFASLLQQVSKDYDLVVLDTPPVHAVTDPSVIGKHAGVVFMVVKYQFNTIPEINDAIKRLSNNGVATKGIIFNSVEHSSKKYGYGYKGSHEYTNYYAYRDKA